jgi:transposase
MPYQIAGIDVHKKMLAVVVADVEVEGDYHFERLKVGTSPAQLRALADWLVEREVEEVVMESTAQYWRPVWEALEYLEAGAPDARWSEPRVRDASPCASPIQSWRRRAPTGFSGCRTIGEASGGPRAHLELGARCRAATLADGDAPQVSDHAQPRAAAQSIGIAAGRSAHQASSLVSDLLGTSARRMLQALADGETDPATLAALADHRLRATAAQLSDALQACATLNPVYRRLLKLTLEELRLIENHLGELDHQMAQLLTAHHDPVQRLAEVPGLGVDSAQQVIAEVGATAATFPSSKHLASWMGACPGSEESAGTNYSHRCPKGNRQMRRVLNQAANAAVKAKGTIFAIVYRRLVPRLGHAQAIGAIAHRLCRLIWKILHEGIRYEERGPAVSEEAKKVRARKMIRELRSLGYHVELLSAPSGSPA